MWVPGVTLGTDYRRRENVRDENTSFCHIIPQIVIRGNKDILPEGRKRRFMDRVRDGVLIV